jgi:hypothetical protein
VSVSLKKEWLGESGYCNCLLVAMSRVQAPQLELSSRRELPNLEVLTVSRPNTCAWVRAQEFDYSALDSTEVIKILARSANMSKLLGWRERGSIIAYDVVEDDGPTVERRFELHLTRSGGAFHLTVTLDTL